ncbi:GNAT family N-acetyltransferase [Nocardia sp. BMG51109]|uniref:GNAT family N-acetyltransferase n=1 Tax=Nocardia sp. BMG51109 TaxID=1056816 RepID=UPI0004AD28EB|nr:GNAT family N-acetyltransferase [Nocardia sp. BMG51109]
MDPVVRPREDSDLTELATVLVRVHVRDGYPVEGVSDPQAWLTPPHELAAWTALLDGRPIGHIALTQAAEDDDAAQLWHQTTGRNITELVILLRLFVDPDHRQFGAGTLLMAAAYEHATTHGRAVAFDVMLKDRAAIRLYEKMGCQRIGTITHTHSGDQAEPAAVYVAPSPPACLALPESAPASFQPNRQQTPSARLRSSKLPTPAADQTL